MEHEALVHPRIYFCMNEFNLFRFLRWPHCEALVGFLQAYHVTGNEHYLTKFKLVADYCLRTFATKGSSQPCVKAARGGGAPKGGWYGYADESGKVTSHNIGMPYKGFFHVPRSLWLSARLLRSFSQKQKQQPETKLDSKL